MRKKLLILLGAALLFSPLPALAQIGQVAILTGTVTDSSGAALVGATVTASSESVIGGSRTMTTDANGVYRFPALPPGTYTVAFELSGFKTRHGAKLACNSGRPSLLIPHWKSAVSPTRSRFGARRRPLKSPPPAPRSIFPRRFSSSFPSRAASDLMPSFSRPASTRTPRRRSAAAASPRTPGWSTASTSATRAAARQWLFANYNWFQEVQFAGLGAPAESGGFTGLASNSLIRSGGNRFSGLFETLYQNKDMTADNIS